MLFSIRFFRKKSPIECKRIITIFVVVVIEVSSVVNIYDLRCLQYFVLLWNIAMCQRGLQKGQSNLTIASLWLRHEDFTQRYFQVICPEESILVSWASMK